MILKDIEVMYAWEYSFTDEQVQDWIDENIKRYKKDGYSYWAVIEEKSGELAGFTGLIKEQADENEYVGIGYIYKNHFGEGDMPLKQHKNAWITALKN